MRCSSKSSEKAQKSFTRKSLRKLPAKFDNTKSTNRPAAGKVLGKTTSKTFPPQLVIIFHSIFLSSFSQHARG